MPSVGFQNILLLFWTVQVCDSHSAASGLIRFWLLLFFFFLISYHGNVLFCVCNWLKLASLRHEHEISFFLSLSHRNVSITYLFITKLTILQTRKSTKTITWTLLKTHLDLNLRRFYFVSVDRWYYIKYVLSLARKPASTFHAFKLHIFYITPNWHYWNIVPPHLISIN